MVEASLRHRGPDAGEVREWPDCTLIHRRLSIIDLSPLGLQPMSNEDETVWTVYNGEIYNHRELRRELEAKGHRFRGHSDTQVILHQYEEDGADFVRKLRGMFAIAVFDLKRKLLLLTRDRFGIKPLFYSHTTGRLAFASEIRALLQMPGVDRTPDSQAVHDFASLFYIPAPQTFFLGIRSLQPGETLVAQLESEHVNIQRSTYHRWTIAPDDSLSEELAVERAADLIDTAVSSQLESDVPLGTLLSGGIDSSLVSASAQRAASNGIRSFNVRFPEDDYDETWAALEVARHIGSDHLTLDMGGLAGTWDHVTGVLRQAGQPYADTSLFAANAVCRLMRKYVTVALSGDGGDEGFGGYDSFWRIEDILRWQRIPAPARVGAAAGAGLLARTGIVSDRLPSRLRSLSAADDSDILQTLLCWIRPTEHRELLISAGHLPVRRHFEPVWDYRLPRGAGRLERLSAHATEVQTRLTLADDYLFKVDTASMKESLEVRVPMLDETLFDFGLTLPHRLKVREKTGKRILRGVAAKRLPASVASKPKGGFMIPVDRWVDSEFRARLLDTLLGPGSALPQFFRQEAYKPIVEDFCEGRQSPGISREGLYQRAIMLLSVQLACEV